MFRPRFPGRRADDLGVDSHIRKPVEFLQFAEGIRQIGPHWLVLDEPPPPARGR